MPPYKVCCISTQCSYGRVLTVINHQKKVHCPKGTSGFCSTITPPLNSNGAVGPKEKLNSLS